MALIDNSPTTNDFSDRVMSRLGEAFSNVLANVEQVRQYDAVSALNDEELADRNMKRQALGREIFLDGHWS